MQVIKNKYLILFISVLLNKSLKAQSYVGGFIGVSESKFYNFRKLNDVDFSSAAKTGYQASLFVELKADSESNFRIETQIKQQSYYININSLADKNRAFNRDLNYKVRQLNLSLNYLFNCINKKNYSIYFLTGPNLFLNVKTTATGSGWNIENYTYTDSSGNIHYTSQKINFNYFNSTETKDIYGVGITWDLGAELKIKLKKNLFVNLQNKYNFYITPASTFAYKIKLFSSYFNVGLSRKFDKIKK